MPAIKISPTDELYQEIEAYAQKQDLSLARASAELIAKALEFDAEPVAPHGGDRRIMRIGKDVKVWQCANCMENFYAKDSKHCPACGKDEWQMVVSG